MLSPRADELIQVLKLQPHPEGGYYREVYRSPLTVAHPESGAPRAALTLIYFLLPAGFRSRWHRVASDESWQFLEGGALELGVADLVAGHSSTLKLGPVAPDQSPLAVVPAGHWQAARPLGDYALVACSVAPGFDFKDFLLCDTDPAIARALSHLAPEWSECL